MSSVMEVNCGEAGVSTGASFTGMIFTIELPVAVSAPPPPWAPELPSLKVQVSQAVIAGESEILR